MRIWDLPPRVLCRQHLLGEHRELHAIWSILTRGKKGYRQHPEVMRWEKALRALYSRHQLLVAEMQKRGYRHLSPLDQGLAKGARQPRGYVDTPTRQRELLRTKGCKCRL
jgi:hypothetical protein